MKRTPYFQMMASGNRCLVLEDGIDYGSFASAAERWAGKLDLRILSREDGLDIRVWDCVREGKLFWLAYDHWFPTISLEPQNAEAGTELEKLGVSLGAQNDSASDDVLTSATP